MFIGTLMLNKSLRKRRLNKIQRQLENNGFILCKPEKDNLEEREFLLPVPFTRTIVIKPKIRLPMKYGSLGKVIYCYEVRLRSGYALMFMITLHRPTKAPFYIMLKEHYSSSNGLTLPKSGLGEDQAKIIQLMSAMYIINIPPEHQTTGISYILGVEGGMLQEIFSGRQLTDVVNIAAEKGFFSIQGYDDVCAFMLHAIDINKLDDTSLFQETISFLLSVSD